MELRQLEYFIAVIDYGGVGRAADALHVAQPSVSQGLRSLERELGVDLFVRTGRRLTPSPAGLALVPSAREALGGVLSLADRAREIQTARLGVVTVSTMPELSSDAVVTWASDFIRAHCNFHFVVTEADSSAGLVASVENGESELGFTSLPVNHGDKLITEVLSTQRLLLVAPPRDRSLAEIADDRGVIRAEDLPNIPIVVSHLANKENNLVSTALSGTGQKFSPRAVVPNRVTQLTFVLHGDMFTFLPLRMALDAYRRGAQLFETAPLVESQFGYLRRASGLSPAARQLVDACITSLQEWNQAVDAVHLETGSYVDALRRLATEERWSTAVRIG